MESGSDRYSDFGKSMSLMFPTLVQVMLGLDSIRSVLICVLESVKRFSLLHICIHISEPPYHLGSNQPVTYTNSPKPYSF
jgi:hypothetical protein